MKQIQNLSMYYISENGDVYSKQRNRYKKLTPQIDSSKYYRIGLVDDCGNKKKYLVHRLVAICYLDNTNNCPVVNHKDGNKQNNHVSNLEWCSYSQNAKHAFSTNLKSNFGENNPKSILTKDQVVEIYLKLFDGARSIDLAREYGVNKNTIDSIKNRKNWSDVTKNLPDVALKQRKEILSQSTVIWICEKLSEGLMPSEVLKLSRNNNISIDNIYDIKARKSFKYISKNYSW